MSNGPRSRLFGIRESTLNTLSGIACFAAMIIVPALLITGIVSFQVVGFGCGAVLLMVGAFNAYTAWTKGESQDIFGSDPKPREPRQGSPVKYIIRHFGIYAFAFAAVGLAAVLAATRT